MKRILLALLMLLPINVHAASIDNKCGPIRVPIVVFGDGIGSSLVASSVYCWQDMTKKGRSVFDPDIEKQLRFLEPGTTVLISLGAVDKDIGNGNRWKDFHNAVMHIQMIASQQKFKWIWIMPPCLLDRSNDWVRSQIESELDPNEIMDWPYCKDSSFKTLESQVMPIEIEFLKRFKY